MAVEAQKRLFTVGEFHRMGEAGILDDEKRYELLGGEVFEMPPVGPEHQGDTDELAQLLTKRLAGRARVRVQGPVVLDDLSEPLPDVVVLRHREDGYRTAHPRPADVLVAIEVSDSSLRRDRQEKLPRYAAAGVPQVLIVDVQGRRIESHTQPSGQVYQGLTVHREGDAVALVAFPDVRLDVSAILG